jgi:hypothetical protein
MAHYPCLSSKTKLPMKNTTKSFPALLILSAALSLPAFAQDAKPAATAAPAAVKPAKPVPTVGEDLLAEITATVEALNVETRELTLKGPLGNVLTVTVDPQVKRLAEFKVGDAVVLTYYASIAAELRAPTAEEKLTPLVVLEDMAKAPAGTAPAAGGLRLLKAVVTIEGLDRSTSTATVKGPRGNSATVSVKSPSVLASLHLGDTVVLTYTEALAIELRPAAAPKAK